MGMPVSIYVNCSLIEMLTRRGKEEGKEAKFLLRTDDHWIEGVMEKVIEKALEEGVKNIDDVIGLTVLEKPKEGREGDAD